jgi:uncharacterized membrane protein
MGNAVSWYREMGADAIAVAASAAIVAGYYLYLRAKVRAHPFYTIHAVNELARSLWVKGVMASVSRDVMAVQTLRNFVMGASLMASTAALLIIGTLTLSGQVEAVSRNWHVMSAYGSVSPELWIVKVLALLADFIVAFFAFAMAVRLANHVGFMINVGTADVPPSLSPEAVARRLNRAGNHFAIGLRAFFFAVPLVFWLFGPAFLVLATLGLVVALHRLDRSGAEATARGGSPAGRDRRSS